MNKKKIAWGASKLLKMYLKRTGNNPFDYCIDNFSRDGSVCDMPVRKSDALSGEDPGSYTIVIFAVSSKALQDISHILSSIGLRYGSDYLLYSDFFYTGFLRKAQRVLGFKLDARIYAYARSFTLNSKTPIHTTVLGTWLFLEILRRVNDTKGQIAEVGAFHGGNALCALNFMTGLLPKRFYIFDSFEGFPELTKHDPERFGAGDYAVEVSLNEIENAFAFFSEAKVIKGFVPATFDQIPEKEKFSLVFYDCDLYQPAIDTFEFFWNKIVPGGYLLVHDYEVLEGGFTGVKKATDEFFKGKAGFCSFFENTMAVIKKT